MFKCVIEADKFGDLQQHYYLTQGDSQDIYVKPLKKDEKIDLSLIKSCEFKLSESDFKQCFLKELTKLDDSFLLKLAPNDTFDLESKSYIYEFVFTFTNTDVDTIQWFFDITPRIKV